MPFNKDFSTLTGKGVLALSIYKWKNPINIEYGYERISNQLYFFWRIMGTTHTFKIDYPQLMQLTNGDYEKHISEFLEKFRQDYLEWAASGFSEPWMREYHQQYKQFIEI